MKLSIMGLEEKIDIVDGELSTLVIQAPEILWKLQFALLNGFIDSNDNEVVIFSEETRLYRDKMLYIPDVVSFQIDNKTIVDKIIKDYIQDSIGDNAFMSTQNDLYSKLGVGFVDLLNEIDVEYIIKKEYENKSFLKLLSLDYTSLDQYDPLEKIVSIMRLYSEVLRKNLFILNGLYGVLRKDEILSLGKTVREMGYTVLNLEYNVNSEVVIAKQTVIDESMAIY